MPVQVDNTYGTVQPPSFDEGAGLPRYDSGPTFDDSIVEEPADNPWDIPYYDTWLPLFNISLVITLLFIAAAIYAALRISQIRRAERAAMEAEMPGLAMSMFLEGKEHGEAHALGSSEQVRWNQILSHSRSDSKNDWRHAIIEADIMLDALATERGYRGDTLGEKLKQVNRESWNTIDAAWEAHKARNRVAHEGAAHELTEREVRRIIALYERVFREFEYID
ncbi:MAG: hypothetical protein Q8P16_01490 [bacterium]|nr:hypothetical protein [bacterium]